MKIKQILTNKWGWGGAVLYFLLGIGLVSNNDNSLLKILCSPITFIVQLIPTPSNLELGVLLYMGIEFFIVSIILGFILGLVAQKLWRKFR